MKMDKEKDFTQRKSLRWKGFDYNRSGMYFITICTKDRRCFLSRLVGIGVLDDPRIELLPFGEIADKYIKQLNNFYDNLSIERYVIMPNHIHILLFIKPNENGSSRTPIPTAQNSIVSRFVSTFKRFCNKDCGKNIWQNHFHDHIIRDHDDYEAYVKYILENPKDWLRDELYDIKC